MQNDELKKEIGVKIKSERTKRGWTQEELANRINAKKSAISNMETGKTNPTIENLNGICLALGIEIWELFVPSLDIIFADQNTISKELKRILSDGSVSLTPQELGLLKMIPVNGIEQQSKTIYYLFLAMLRMMGSPEFQDLQVND